MKVLQDDGGALCVRSDWRERVNVIRPGLLEFQARRNGITRVEVARALASSFEGRAVGFYREPGSAGTGVFPQETRLLPIVARPPLAERVDVGTINSLQIWSPVAGRMIPLNQITAGAAGIVGNKVIGGSRIAQCHGLPLRQIIEAALDWVGGGVPYHRQRSCLGRTAQREADRAARIVFITMLLREFRWVF